MNNKKLKLNSLFFFAGLFFFLISIVRYVSFLLSPLNDYSILQRLPLFISLLFQILIYIGFGIFVIKIADINNKDTLIKVRKYFLGIFIFSIASCIIVPIVNSLHISNIFETIIMFLPRCTPFSGLFYNLRNLFSLYFSITSISDFFSQLLPLVGCIFELISLNEAINAPEKTEETVVSEKSEKTDLTKKMDFFESIKSCYVNYFSFNGCATRSEYWFFQLYQSIISIILFLFTKQLLNDYNLVAYKNIFIVTIFFALFNIYPSFCVTVRRMHDVGHIGAYYIIPIAGFIALFMPSEPLSEYRTRRNLHPTCDVLVKILILIIIIVYIYFFSQTLSYL